MCVKTGFFSEIFRRGGRSIDRHAPDLTNVWDYFRNHGRGLLDHVHNYIHVYSLGSLRGGGKTAMKREKVPPLGSM